MKAGKVVNIRVNPKDCMAVVDVVQKTGVFVSGMSFSQMVSLALAGVMQTLRDASVIPDREGWEYLEMMQPYLTRQNGRKLEVAKVISSLGSELSVKGLSAPKQEEPESSGYVYTPPVLTEEQIARINELNEVMDTRPLNTMEQQEYDKLAALF